MKTFILTIALTAALLAQPNQLDLRQDPPTAVQSERVSSAYTGTSGAAGAGKATAVYDGATWRCTAVP